MQYAFRKPHYVVVAFIIDMIGNILFLFRKYFKKTPPADPHHILIIRLDHIGDFVTTMPLVHNLKRHFPDARITMVVNPSVAELASRDTAIDEVIPFSLGHLARPAQPINWSAVWSLGRRLQREHIDLGIEPRGDFPSLVLLWLSGAHYRIGYGITGGGFLLDWCAHYDRDAQIIERNLSLVRDALGIRASDRQIHITWNDADRRHVDAMLTKAGAVKKEIIVLHPYVGNTAREWIPERFQELVNRLASPERAVLLVGSNNDQPAYQQVYDLRGGITLPQLCYLVSRASLFIGLNSGPANIALAAGTPSVIIASGTNAPEIWLPSHERSRFVYCNVPCKPCAAKVCPHPMHDCMREISVDEVLQAVKAVTV